MKTLLVLFFVSAQTLSLEIPEHHIQFRDQALKKIKNRGWIDLTTTLPDDYLDQVIYRKKTLIQKCASSSGSEFKNFLVEITVKPSGKTKARLISSSNQNKEILKCAIRIFNRIQFKKFKGPAIVKSYNFQFI